MWRQKTTQSSLVRLKRPATASTSRSPFELQSGGGHLNCSSKFSGPRPDESVAHEASPDHEDDLSGPEKQRKSEIL